MTKSKGDLTVLTLDQRDDLLRRQGEVLQELETLRSAEFCPGDEAPLILEDDLNRDLDRISATLREDDQWELGGEG